MSEVLEEKSKLPLFAPEEILEEVTGFKAPYKQIEWLSKNGWPFIVNGARHPKVLMEIVLQRGGLTRSSPTVDKSTNKWQPDYSALIQGNTS